MEQIQYQSYEDGTQYKPGYTPDLLPAMEQEAKRQSQADQAALVQLQQNNKQRVENSKLAGRDMLELSKFSATIAKEVGEIYKKNEDEKAVNEVYDSIVNGVPEDIALVEAEQIAQATQEGENVNAAATAIEEETGDIAAGEAVRQDFGQNAQAQVASRGDLIKAQAAYPSFIQSWLASDTKITVAGEEMTVAQAVALGDPRIIQSVIALGRNKFIRDNNLQSARKLDVNRILGRTIIQSDASAAGTAVRDAIKARKEAELSDLTATTYDVTSNLDGEAIGDTFGVLAEQYWQSNLFTTRAAANEALIKDMLEPLIDKGDVEGIRALGATQKVPGQKGSEIESQYGNLINDAVRLAEQNAAGIRRQEQADIEANMYEELNGITNPTQRAAVVESYAAQLESAGLFREARELRSQQQALTTSGATDRNNAVLFDQIRRGEITDKAQLEQAYARGEITQAQLMERMSQLDTKQSSQTPNVPEAGEIVSDYVSRFQSDFFPLAGLARDANGNYIDPLTGEAPLITLGQAKVLEGAVQSDLNIVLNATLAANPGIENNPIALQQLLRQTANDWYKDNVLTPDGKYSITKLRDHATGNSSAFGDNKYPKGEQQRWADILNSPQFLSRPQGFPDAAMPRDLTGVTISPANASEFNPVRGDRLYNQETLEGFVEKYKESGVFDPNLVDVAETLGMTPLALLQQQLGANRMDPVAPSTPETSTSTGDVTSAVQGAQMLMARGFPSRGAAWLAGNIQTESTWYGQRPAWDDVGAPAGGLVSWRAARLDAIESHYGRPINSITNDEQMTYMIQEMKTSYPEAYAIFMNPYSTDRDLIRASKMYWGYGEEGGRYANARSIERQM